MEGEPRGCEHCWPEDAAKAGAALMSLTVVAELIDQSHFHVMVRACPHCSQPYLTVFAERVDWANSDDSQYWSRMPLTAEEAASLTSGRERATEAGIRAISPDRRALQHDYPSGEPARVYWTTGMAIGPHD